MLVFFLSEVKTSIGMLGYIFPDGDTTDPCHATLGSSDAVSFWMTINRVLKGHLNVKIK